MRIRPARAVFAAAALAEVGAVAGTLVCWLFFTGWAVFSYGYGTLRRNDLLGIALWAFVVGIPFGAITTPLLALSVLRRAPLWRVLVLPAVGAFVGLVIGATFSPRPAVLPVPALVVSLAAGGLIAGSLVARLDWRRALASLRGRLSSLPPANGR
jgi:hypothetical protein